MQDFPAHLSEMLARHKAENSLRPPGTTGGLVDFSSNDFLGMASSPALFEATGKFLQQKNIAVSGATGSRLITGNHMLYLEAEEIIARFHQSDCALIFNSGYDASVGFFSSVPQKGDVVLYDEYIHASIRDGLKLSGAQSYKFSHNDKEALYKLVERYRSKATELYIVTEAVFTLDGDTPNLEAYADIADRYRCRLVVDEAHSVGVFGDMGQGLMQAYGLHSRVFARFVTFGKALGSHGAAVLGCEDLISFLANFARSFVHTTALPPHSVATIISSYTILKENQEAVVKLQAAISYFKTETERCHLPFILSFSAVHSIVVPGNGRARKIAGLLQRAGYSVKAVLAPAVPAGQERLRFCVHSFNTRTEMGIMMDLLTQAIRFS
jgi:8-amino-7-oxononanoate synthase